MDDESAQISDTVPNGVLRNTWTTRARQQIGRLRAAIAPTDSILARCGFSDQQVTDDEIYEILTAGGNGKITADLCVAKGVTVPRYCVWKAKYRGLSLDELRKVRRAELTRARCLVGVLVIAAVAAGGGVVLRLARPTQHEIAASAGAASAGLAARPRVEAARTNSNNKKPQSLPATKPASLASAGTTAAVPGLGAPADQRDSQSGRQRDRASAPPAAERRGPPTDKPQYNVQVVAAATPQQGRLFVDRLAAAGHAASMAAARVNDVEVFRVRVGPFDTLSQAERVSRQLRRNGYGGAWVVR
jgi:cell division septation protein DedD